MGNYLPFLALFIGSCGYAAIKGGVPERIVAAAFVIAAILSLLVVRAMPFKYRTLELGVFLVDLLLFAVLLWVALKSDRFWPIWVAALQIIALFAHLAMPLYQEVIPWAYQLVVTKTSYPMLLILAIGTRRHQLRQRHSRHAISLTPSSSPSRPAVEALPPG